MQIVIPSDAVSSFEDKVAKINKRLSKALLPNITYSYGEEYVYHNMFVVPVEISEIELKGLGFTPIARIEMSNSGDDNLVFTYDGKPAPQKCIDYKGGCDHCNINRFRKVVYLVRDKESGIEMFIGSSCMEVACGIDASVLVAYDKAVTAIYEMDDEDWGKSSYNSYAFTLRTVVAVANNLIAQGGYVSGKTAYEMGYESTSDKVAAAMRDGLVKPSEEDYARADFAIALAENLGDESNFNQNMRTIAKTGFVARKKLGFAAYMPVLVMKEEAAAKRVKGAEYFGTIGTRYKKQAAEVTNVYRGTSLMGEFVIVTFLLECGNVLKWMTNTIADEMKNGAKLTIDFTVKAHKEFKGSKETNVNRVKVVK